MLRSPYEPEFYKKIERAWLLVSDPYTNVPNKLFEPNNLHTDKGGDGFFIVRADKVKTGSGEDHLMVPVYYIVDDNKNGLDEAIRELGGIGGVDTYKVDTNGHNPIKPHRARGYIPIDECNQIQPGPQDWNTWG